MTTDLMPNAEAGPSTAPLTPGPTMYHESSQFRHWRYSTEQLSQLRLELNKKSLEVVVKNQALERIDLNHNPPNPAPAAAYLSVEDELLLLRFYCIQVSKICRHGFGLPEQVEATAISYLKRFYLKNSVMEWHPKTIMPTCLFLAAKTTNYPVLIDAFIPKFAKLQAADIIDTEFLVAQSLAFEFWVRGAEKAVRGWFLEFQVSADSSPKPASPISPALKEKLSRQEQPSHPISTLQTSLPAALLALSRSRLTDLEFTHTPSQISLGCWHIAASTSVLSFLQWRYDSLPSAYGMPQTRLLEILDDIKVQIERVEVDTSGEMVVDVKGVKNVDKRLKGCTNPEKTPGTALYLQRKQKQEAQEASVRASKSIKAQREMRDREMVFGDVVQTASASGQGTKRQPLSPMITVPSPNPFLSSTSGASVAGGTKRIKLTLGGKKKELVVEDGPGKADAGVKLEEGGMGVKDEAMGYVVGGKGLTEVGRSLADDDE